MDNFTDTMEKRWAWALANKARSELKEDPRKQITVNCWNAAEIISVYRPAFRKVLGDELLKRVIFKEHRKE